MARLLAAVRTLRQHAGIARLGAAAAGPAIAEWVAVSAGGALELHLDATAVLLGQHLVARHATDEVPFGALAACGISGLRLPAAMTAEALRRLLEVLAQGPADPGQAAAWIEAIDGLGVPGLWLSAAGPGPLPAAGIDHEAWWLLPAEGPVAAAFQPLRERAAEVDLAAAAADRLLDELGTPAAAPSPLAIASGALLQSLVELLCERGQVGHVAEIFTRMSQTAAIPSDERLQLWERLRRRFDGPWLLAQRQHPERWPGLVALALQLDGDALELLQAALGPQALPAWLQGLLPPPARPPAAPR